jgi:4-hydroxy-3-methylbut-2-enyl diphosphate reductase
MVPFGAFVELIPGVDGLIHISQISNKRIGKPEDVLALGSTVEAKITSLDFDSQKISLSIRELLGEPEPQAAPAAAQEEKKEDQIPSEYREDVKVTIGDMLNNKTENN